MEIVDVKISDLKPSEYNPRALSKKEAKDLRESLERFGMVEPIVVNRTKHRMNVIVGGHQRYYILKEMGRETIPVVYVDLPDIKKEQELNIRLNKNVGHWEWDLLANFDKELLTEAGFEMKELEEGFGIEEEPEVEFSKELMLENNYIVLYFDNMLDWEVAKDKFELKKVKDLILRKGQPTGVGRVMDGKEWLERIK